jgi:hypothetical protein
MDVGGVPGDETPPDVHRRDRALLDGELRHPARVVHDGVAPQGLRQLRTELPSDLVEVLRLSVACRVQQTPLARIREREQHQCSACREQPVQAVALQIGVHDRVSDQPRVGGVACQRKLEHLADSRVSAVASPEVPRANGLLPSAGAVA